MNKCVIAWGAPPALALKVVIYLLKHTEKNLPRYFRAIRCARPALSGSRAPFDRRFSVNKLESFRGML